MLKKFLLTILCVYILSVPGLVQAHTVGQPPFFRINGVFSNFYAIPEGSYIAITPFPQDMAPEMYLTHTPIEFAFDIDQLSKVVPLEVINKTKFDWNFGDGTTGVGQHNTHSYEKQGSYVLSIKADTRSFEANAEPQVIQSVMLHIVDTREYSLPKLQIEANGFDGKDVRGDWLEQDLSKPLAVKGTATQSGSAKIMSYQWDFGDGFVVNGQTATHTYQSAPASVMVMLRTKDANGFISDAAIGVVHNPNASNSPPPSSLPPKGISVPGIVIIPLFFLIFLVTLIYIRNRSI